MTSGCKTRLRKLSPRSYQIAPTTRIMLSAIARVMVGEPIRGFVSIALAKIVERSQLRREFVR